MIIKTWVARCEEFDDMHITTYRDIQMKMQDEIDELRAALARAEAAERLLQSCVKHETARAERAEAENAALREAMAEVVRISDRKHDAWDKAHALLDARKP